MHLSELERAYLASDHGSCCVCSIGDGKSLEPSVSLELSSCSLPSLSYIHHFHDFHDFHTPPLSHTQTLLLPRNPQLVFARICWTAGNPVRPWLNWSTSTWPYTSSGTGQLGLPWFRSSPFDPTRIETQARDSGLDARDSTLSREVRELIIALCT